MRALDTNIIIFYVLGDSKFGKRASEIMKSIDNGEEIFIPLAMLKESMFILLSHGRSLQEALDVILSFQRGNAEIVEDDFNTFVQGLEISKKYGINPTDGVISAMMLKHGVAEIYSNDPHFDRVPGIKHVF